MSFNARGGLVLTEDHSFKSKKMGEKLMGKLQGSALQRIPKGFDAEHPAADLLKMKQWLYYTVLDAKLATSPRLVPEITRRFRAMAPVVVMLNAPLKAARTRATFEEKVFAAPV